MPGLVALDLDGGSRFVDALIQVWGRGDAVAVLDRRLPPPAAAELLGALRPTSVLDASGERPVTGGAEVEPGDALVVATSGSSGSRKAAVLTHSAVAASARATTAVTGVDPSQHRWLCCLPLTHIGGLSVVTRSVLTATPLTVLPSFDASVVESLGRRRRATHVSLVLTAMRRIDPAVFTRIVLGGAAAPEVLPANVVTTYGMTETGSGVVYDGIPLPGVEVAISDGADGGTAGEIMLRCPMQLRAYRDGSDPTVPGPGGTGGWLATGDGGRLEDGRLVVDGRLDEVVVTGAEKVWPNAVEGVLATHPKVAEIAVWKRPDPEWGERVVAWVVPRDPADPPSLDDLAALTGERLARWAAPKELVLVDALPRTGSGKVRRAGLS
ncbi:MAG: class I adenylate-forming enzyme family protein [Acidimicrobiales bacterium]